jgi:hypothetical protein
LLEPKDTLSVSTLSLIMSFVKTSKQLEQVLTVFHKVCDVLSERTSAPQPVSSVDSE